MPFLQDYECGRGHRFEHMHFGPRGIAPAHLLCRECLGNSLRDAKDGLLSKDVFADKFTLRLYEDEDLRLHTSKVICEMTTEDVYRLPDEMRKQIVHREAMYDSASPSSYFNDLIHRRCKLRVWVVLYEKEHILFSHGVIAFPVISTSAAPITINRRNGDYAAREKERLTKRSKEHNRLKTSREEADANTERVVGKDTANVLFSKGLHA